jgi:hypothetical protein
LFIVGLDFNNVCSPESDFYRLFESATSAAQHSNDSQGATCGQWDKGSERTICIPFDRFWIEPCGYGASLMTKPKDNVATNTLYLPSL